MDQPSGPPERRAIIRQLCGPEVSCRLRAAASGGTLWARVRDVSTSGLGLLLARPLAPGSFLAVELRASGIRYPLMLEARVAQARREPDGSWYLGCVLLYPLPEEMLPALTADAAAAAPVHALVLPPV
jgi:hypothetical protein